VKKELTLKNELTETSKVREAIDSLLETHPFSQEASFQMNLIAEELFTNVVRHGFQDGAQHLIWLSLSVTPEEWEITIEDDGIPFDPTKAPEPDTLAPILERSIGGLGIHLIRNIASVFQYQRSEKKNIVYVKKNLVPV
jgi:serine/threonine-protein kinase RsbW